MSYNRKYCLLILLCCCQTVFGQQKIVDSLLGELKIRTGKDSSRLGLLNDLGWAYRTVDASKGLSISDEAIALGKTLGDDNRLASAYNTKAWNYSSLGQDSAAITVFTQALAIRTRMKDSTGIAKIRYNIGIMYFNLSDYPRALEYQQQALYFFTARNDKMRMANCYNAIGLTYQYVSDYPKALDCYLRTLSIYQQYGNGNGLPATLTNIGILYKNMQRFDKALEYHRKALDLYRQTGDQQGVANCLGNIGVVYDELGQTEKSLDYYSQALTLCRQIGYQSGIASNLTNIGTVNAALGRSGPALDNLQQARQIYRDIGDKNNQGENLAEMAKVYSSAPDSVLQHHGIPPAQRYRQAHALLQQALTLAREIRSPGRQQTAWQYLAELYEQEHDYAAALPAWRQSILFRDSVTNTERAKEITRKELQYDFEKQQALVTAENDKQKALAAAAINRQLVLRNSILAGVALLMLTALAMFMLYKKRRDAEYQRQDAELRAEVAETEMKALRTQMNPHFIFNSLNSISDFIGKNDTKTADSYLTRFAQLMRLILENSEWVEVSLQDDLKALELYIQLESIRLNHSFSYEIRVDPSIDKELTLIPPLILQPFVENSIWHGVSQMAGKGRILVHIWKKEDMLHCIVSDNGPGLSGTPDASISSKSSGLASIPDPVIAGASRIGTPRDRKSLGQKITRSRIDIINKIKNKNASLTVTNLAEGMKVEVILPLELRF